MLRRTPLKRKAPLRAKTRLKPRSATKKYARRPRDLAFMQWVKSLPCCGPFPHACQGPSEAHHAGQRGLGMKAPDRTCIPLCRVAHKHWHDGGATFGGWTRLERRVWADTTVRSLNHLYDLTYMREAA